MKMLRNSKVPCWPIGPQFNGKGGVYQQVQVAKVGRPRARMTERAENGRIKALPFVSRCHLLTVRVENIVEAA